MVRISKRSPSRPGDRFGRLVLLGMPFSCGSPTTLGVFECDCGNVVCTILTNIYRGKTSSCGCLHLELLRGESSSNYTHGLSSRSKRLYSIWCNMKKRCYDTRHRSYFRYGGRGIVMCDDWLDAEKFGEWAMSNGYEDHLTVDRIRNDEGYSPDNCRWVTYGVQSRNRSNSTILEIEGESRNLTDWASDPGCEVKLTSICGRLAAGWSQRDAVFAPKGTRNIAKLQSRQQRNALGGSGDNR